MALVACVLWLAGFEVLPWLHVAFHDELAPHIHAADGTIIRVSFTDAGGATHRHADGSVHRDRDDRPIGAPPARGRHRPDRPTGPSYALDHGAGSLAHHGVAVVPAAAPLHTPLPVHVRPVVVALASTSAPIEPSVPVASARGPPAALSPRV
jgi:hypothetical protein